MIYWFLGSIDCLDDLLRAGITLAESVVVVNKELSNSAEEDTLSDCNTIVAVLATKSILAIHKRTQKQMCFENCGTSTQIQ